MFTLPRSLNETLRGELPAKLRDGQLETLRHAPAEHQLRPITPVNKGRIAPHSDIGIGQLVGREQLRDVGLRVLKDYGNSVYDTSHSEMLCRSFQHGLHDGWDPGHDDHVAGYEPRR